MKEEKVYFENNEQKIVGILHIPDNENSSAIIMCHGFTGNMCEHGLFINTAKKLCKSGFTVLRFDFRGSNESEGKFRDMTISGEVSDLKKAIEFILKQKINKDKIGVLGLSLGAVVSVLGWDEKIKALVLLSPASNSKKVFANSFGKYVINEIEQKGFYDLQKSGWRSSSQRTSFEVGKGFWEEAKKTNLINNIKNIKCPILIVQGDADDTVDWHDSNKLYNAANKPKKIKIIKNADHVFNDAKHEEELIQLSLDWFNKWLK